MRHTNHVDTCRYWVQLLRKNTTVFDLLRFWVTSKSQEVARESLGIYLHKGSQFRHTYGLSHPEKIDSLRWLYISVLKR
jgi:hypothetical protein